MGVLALVVTTWAIGACASSDRASATSGGSESPSGCLEAPLSCPVGETCWASQQAGKFACQSSGKGKAGEACLNYFDQPACEDGLTCFAVQGYPEVCTPFCEPSQSAPCAGGATCQSLKDKDTGTVFFACLPAQSGAGGGGAGTDGGAGAGGSANDAGTDAPSGDGG